MEAGYQQAGSPAPEGIAVGDRRRWPRAAVVAGAVAAALLVGAATRGRPPAVAALATADATTAGEAATPFRVGAYSEGYGRLNTSYYPFLFGKADAVLVEPHRDYVLRVEGGGAGATYAWSGVASGAGPDLNVRFNRTGIYRFLTVTETGALGVASALNVTLYVKYRAAKG